MMKQLLRISLLLVLACALAVPIPAQEIINVIDHDDATVTFFDDNSLQLYTENAITDASFVLEIKDANGWASFVPSASFTVSMKYWNGSKIPSPYIWFGQPFYEWIDDVTPELTNPTHFSFMRANSEWNSKNIRKGKGFHKSHTRDFLTLGKFVLGKLFGGIHQKDYFETGKYEIVPEGNQNSFTRLRFKIDEIRHFWWLDPTITYQRNQNPNGQWNQFGNAMTLTSNNDAQFGADDSGVALQNDRAGVWMFGDLRTAYPSGSIVSGTTSITLTYNIASVVGAGNIKFYVLDPADYSIVDVEANQDPVTTARGFSDRRRNEPEGTSWSKFSSLNTGSETSGYLFGTSSSPSSGTNTITANANISNGTIVFIVTVDGATDHRINGLFQDNLPNPSISFNTDDFLEPFFAEAAVLENDEYIISGTSDGLATDDISPLTIATFSDTSTPLVQVGTSTVNDASNSVYIFRAPVPAASQDKNAVLTVTSGGITRAVPVVVGSAGGGDTSGLAAGLDKANAGIYGTITNSTLATLVGLNVSERIAPASTVLNTVATNVLAASASTGAKIDTANTYILSVSSMVQSSGSILPASGMFVPSLSSSVTRDGTKVVYLEGLSLSASEPTINFYILENGLTDRGAYNQTGTNSFTWSVASATSFYIHRYLYTGAIDISSATANYDIIGTVMNDGNRVGFTQRVTLNPSPAVDTSDLFTDDDANTYLADIHIPPRAQRWTAVAAISRATAGRSATDSFYVPLGAEAGGNDVINGVTYPFVNDYTSEVDGFKVIWYRLPINTDFFTHMTTLGYQGYVESATGVIR